MSSDRIRRWDDALKAFFDEMGLYQTLVAFENDLLVLNADWEEGIIHTAAKKLIHNLQVGVSSEVEQDLVRASEERKLGHIHLSDNRAPHPQSSLNRTMATMIANNRARNDKSNLNEFVKPIERMQERGDDSSGSCARTDAKVLNRDVQMRYDIVKNEDGPLRRTVKALDKDSSQPLPEAILDGGQNSATTDEGDMASRIPGLDERVKNIEQHLAVRYVPTPPKTLLMRLKYLEDHIIKLEREYPPWAALHFNQPNRGWPPPPRSIPIIVPPNLRRTEKRDILAPLRDSPESLPSSTKVRHTASSLHRAVLEQLEVQQAKSNLSQ
ncbi:hypothetical protein AX16_002099 [Volvariella volvacea WC 439]|nr:hypothetical protein AX16_002099 [Volvariella volvacea WC 439]